MMRGQATETGLEGRTSQALAVLRALAKAGQLGLTDLSIETGMSLDQVRPIANALLLHGYVSKGGGGRNPGYELAQVPAWAALAIDQRDRPKERRCLKCPKTFMSTHAGNRLCESCQASNARLSHGLTDPGCAAAVVAARRPRRAGS